MGIYFRMIHRILFIFLAFIFFSCEGKKENIPAFLHIEKIGLRIDPLGGQGSNDSKITDAKVFANDQLVGIFELPVNVPILETGNIEIKISPVIKNNGISNERIVYPFYTDFSANMNLVAGVVNDFPAIENTVLENGLYHPLVTYFPDAYDFWLEDFELGADFKFDSIQGSDVNIKSVSFDSLQYINGGFSCGQVIVDESHPHFLIRNRTDIEINKSFKVYLEVNYRTNCIISVGLYETFPELKKIYLGKGVNPSLEWNKIYIELTNEANFAVNGTAFQFYFEGDKPPSEDGFLYIDNVKLIYPKDE